MAVAGTSNISITKSERENDHLVDEGGRARDKLDVVSIKDELILDLLRTQDGHTIEHVNLPHLCKGGKLRTPHL
jgi:hypothetical protein